MGALHGYALSNHICSVSTLLICHAHLRGCESFLAEGSPYPWSDSCFTVANRLQDIELPLGTIAALTGYFHFVTNAQQIP